VLQNCKSSSCEGTCITGQTGCIPDAGTLQPDGAPAAPYCTYTGSDNANCGACFNTCPYNTPLCVSGDCYALDATPG
jgi:hypothetical protein